MWIRWTEYRKDKRIHSEPTEIYKMIEQMSITESQSKNSGQHKRQTTIKRFCYTNNKKLCPNLKTTGLAGGYLLIYFLLLRN